MGGQESKNANKKHIRCETNRPMAAPSNDAQRPPPAQDPPNVETSFVSHFFKKTTIVILTKVILCHFWSF